MSRKLLLLFLMLSLLPLMAADKVNYQLTGCESGMISYHFSQPLTVVGSDLVGKLQAVKGVNKAMISGPNAKNLNVSLAKPPYEKEDPDNAVIKAVEKTLVNQFKAKGLELVDITTARYCVKTVPVSYTGSN